LRKLVAIFGVLLLLIALVAFGPALVAVASQFVAEAFGCTVDLNRVIPCEIGGKDYGQTFYDLGFLIWYSYVTLPIGAVLAAIWAAAALIALIGARGKSGARGNATARSPGMSFLRGAIIAVLLGLSPIAITYTAGFIASGIGCDLNEVSQHPCPLLGINVGPLLQTMAQSIWFIAPTVLAGLIALLALAIVFVVRMVRARRARVDAAGAKA
jgi:TRAP-type C4-dicarboxylate transport system permease small subunit